MQGAAVTEDFAVQVEQARALQVRGLGLLVERHRVQNLRRREVAAVPAVPEQEVRQLVTDQRLLFARGQGRENRALQHHVHLGVDVGQGGVRSAAGVLRLVEGDGAGERERGGGFVGLGVELALVGAVETIGRLEQIEMHGLGVLALRLVRCEPLQQLGLVRYEIVVHRIEVGRRMRQDCSGLAIHDQALRIIATSRRV
ncbi:MAG: hypothetical protein CMJ18_20980 [Phycisphaeraceae bacterium]|nr:hypothetical protein [Phycisphaeraceae bacterium]